jgi:hypothetical protein
MAAIRALFAMVQMVACQVEELNSPADVPLCENRSEAKSSAAKFQLVSMFLHHSLV